MRPDVLGVGPLSVAEDLGLRPFGREFPGLTPRFSNIRVSAPQTPHIQDPGPNLSKPGALFHRISNIWGSGPCVHQYPGFRPPRSDIKFRLLLGSSSGSAKQGEGQGDLSPCHLFLGFRPS